MGRIATGLAARFVDANNLPDTSKLPEISTIGALLPSGAKKMLASMVPSLKRSKVKSQVSYIRQTTLTLLHKHPSPCQAMSFFCFKKPFKLFVIDADTGQPTDPNVKKRTYVKYYEVQKQGDGKKTLIAHKGHFSDGKPEKPGDKKDIAEFKEQDKKEGDQPNADFAAEDDAKLKELKAANQSWKNIAAEMGKGPAVLKKRWKEIEQAGKSGNEDKNDDEKGNGKHNKNHQDGKGKTGKGDEPDWKNMTPSEKRREGEKRKAAKKAGKEKHKDSEPAKNEGLPTASQSVREKTKSSKKTAPSTTAGSEARFTMQEWLTLQQDDMFSFDELRFLAELLTQRPDSTWDRVAARFFDKTGRRVHPMDIRDKFEEVTKMQ